MRILISILAYALISFFMYKLLETKKVGLTFIVNTLGLLCYYFINNGTNHLFLSLVVSVVNGCLFSLIGINVYNEGMNLNSFLGTTVLIEFILSLGTNFIFVLIFLS